MLRDDPDGNCYAEDSFVVQLKSASAPIFGYQGHELNWFLHQTQPMFIGLVSAAKGEISLYPTIYINQAVLSLNSNNVTVRFGPSDNPGIQSGQKWCPWKGASETTVWLGPPALQWTLSDVGNKEKARRTYDTLKKMIGVIRRELVFISLGQCSILEWSTNDMDSINSRLGMMKSHPDDLTHVAESCVPCLRAVMNQALNTMSAEASNPLMLPALALASALKEATGVEIDPDGMFGKFCFALNKHREIPAE